MTVSLPEPTILRWLRNHQVVGLPDRVGPGPAFHVSPVVHHPDGCHYIVSTKAPVYGAPDENFLCGCVVRDVCKDFDINQFFAVVRKLVVGEEYLARALDPSTYSRDQHFASFIPLALRHHRYHAARYTKWGGLLTGGSLFADCPELEKLRLSQVRAWDDAELQYALDMPTMTTDAISYAVREIVIARLWRRPLLLPVLGTLTQLVSCWLAGPASGTLHDAFYSQEGDELRQLIKRFDGGGFTLALLDEITVEVESLRLQDELVACHVGSPDLAPFSDTDGARGLLVFGGLRARADSVALGEYPQVVAEFLEERKSSNHRDTQPTSGGSVSRICTSPLTEDHQWEIALSLWNDSFSAHRDDTEDPGPYRDQRTAIYAAAAL